MQTNSKTAAFTIRVPLAVGKALKKAERPGVNYRDLAEQAVCVFAQNLAVFETTQPEDTEKAA